MWNFDSTKIAVNGPKKNSCTGGIWVRIKMTFETRRGERYRKSRDEIGVRVESILVWFFLFFSERDLQLKCVSSLFAGKTRKKQAIF